jgi:Ni,Fe-hydrogenase I cytochrome b subunit
MLIGEPKPPCPVYQWVPLILFVVLTSNGWFIYRPWSKTLPSSLAEDRSVMNFPGTFIVSFSIFCLFTNASSLGLCGEREQLELTANRY